MKKLILGNISVILFALMFVSIYYENAIGAVVLFVISQLLFVLRK